MKCEHGHTFHSQSQNRRTCICGNKKIWNKLWHIPIKSKLKMMFLQRNHTKQMETVLCRNIETNAQHAFNVYLDLCSKLKGKKNCRKQTKKMTISFGSFVKRVQVWLWVAAKLKKTLSTNKNVLRNMETQLLHSYFNEKKTRKNRHAKTKYTLNFGSYRVQHHIFDLIMILKKNYTN